MATLQKRSKVWRAQVRRKGYPSVTRTSDTKADAATAWARETEREMDRCEIIGRTEAGSSTLKQALQRYLKEITSTKKGERCFVPLSSRALKTLSQLAEGHDIFVAVFFLMLPTMRYHITIGDCTVT